MKKILAAIAALVMFATYADASQLRFAEDSAATDADTGIQGLTVRLDTPASTAGTSGDYASMVTNSSGALYVQNIGGTKGGLSIYRNLDIDETTGTTTQQLKGSAGTLYNCAVSNNTASTVEYVKFYNAVSLTGSAAGTETPVITLPIAGATTINLNFGVAGMAFDTGMTVAATTGIADNDTGAPAANAIVLNCVYK